MNDSNSSTRTSRSQRFIIAGMLAVAAVAAAAILRVQPPRPADEHGHDEHAHGAEHRDEHGHGQSADATGPNGGKLMTDGDFGLEVRLVEDGGAPRLKIWLSEKGKPMAPSHAKVNVTVNRPDGQQQELSFRAEGDALVSEQPVPEPHVFDATIAAQTATEPFLFDYSQQEGRVNMTDEQVKSAGVRVEPAAASVIRSVLQLPAEIRLNEDRTSHLSPRASGVVESVPVSSGQFVRKGQVLAVISSPALSQQRGELEIAERRVDAARATYERERQLHEEKITARQDMLQAQAALREAEIALATARQKLQGLGGSAAASGRYEMRAPFDGVVVERKLSVGESVKEDAPVFVLSDISTVWAVVNVPSQELAQVSIGQPVTLRAAGSTQAAQGQVSHVSTVIGEQTRSAQARVVVRNPGNLWRPGLFVTAEIVIAQQQAPVTVPAKALQTLDGKPTVYLKVAGGFVPQAVQVGRNDGQRVEIVAGLAPGSQVAADGSFVVKAEQGKSKGGHGH